MGGENTEAKTADPHILRRNVNVWDEEDKARETRTLINACKWCNMYAQAMGYTTAHINAAGKFQAARQAVQTAKRPEGGARESQSREGEFESGSDWSGLCVACSERRDRHLLFKRPSRQVP